MQNGHAPYQTHLFRLRLWQEPVDTDTYEWRGQVTCVDTGELRAFRTWDQLIDLLTANVEGDLPGEPPR